MDFARPEHHKIPFAQHHGFLLLAFRQERDVFVRQPVGIRRTVRQGAEGHPFLTLHHDLDVQIARMKLGAAFSKRLSHVFRDQIKQSVAIDIMLAGRRGVGDVALYIVNGLAQFVRQPGLEMVDVADDHEKTLNVKQRFIFVFYTRVRAAIPVLFL